MAFTQQEEKALHFATLALKKEISYYERLVASLEKDGKGISAIMMRKQLDYYEGNLKELEAIRERGYFREENQ